MKFKNYWFILIFLFIIITGTIFSVAQTKGINSTGCLSTLCKIWGFLKYYHPSLADGLIDWDEVLVSSIPEFSSITNKEELNSKILELINKAGGINFFDYDETFLDFPISDPTFKWIEDRKFIDWYSALLLKILMGNGVEGYNHYVQYAEYIGCAEFKNEKRFSIPNFPEEPVRLLALFRYWNIIQYFFPYKDLMDNNWDSVLDEYIPLVMKAEDALDYSFIMRKFTAETNDGHSVFGSRAWNNYWGDLSPPFESRYIEGKTIINIVYQGLITNGADIRPGDIIKNFNGRDIEDIKSFTLQYMAGSNEVSKHRNANFFMFTGETDNCEITILRNGVEKNYSLQRFPYGELLNEEIRTAGPSWSILSGNIGYINMGLLMPEQIKELFTDPEFINTKGIIFDIRNYPNEGTAWKIMQYMVPFPVRISLFKIPNQKKPGEFLMENSNFFGNPWGNEDYYKGIVVILVDEKSISRSEYLAMALQKCPKATTIGSQTAGADGNVTGMWLPGNIYTGISGIGVFYPDGSLTQRVGVKIDHTILPTIKGIQQGRDEVLEFAINFISD